MKTNFTIALISMTLLSCSDQANPLSDETIVLSDELSKEDALRILKEDYRGEQCEGNIWKRGNVRENDYQKNRDILFELENQGLIKMNYKNYGGRDESVSFTLTGAGAGRYEHNDYRTALTEERPFEIIGMSTIDERTTNVAFTVVVESTPFYPLATEYGETKCPLGGKNERDATFIKYDTGWKLKNE
jgi:hypothetical protein